MDSRQDYQHGPATVLRGRSLETHLNVNIRLIHYSSHYLASDCSPWIVDQVVSSPRVMPPGVTARAACVLMLGGRQLFADA